MARTTTAVEEAFTPVMTEAKAPKAAPVQKGSSRFAHQRLITEFFTSALPAKRPHAGDDTDDAGGHEDAHAHGRAGVAARVRACV